MKNSISLILENYNGVYHLGLADRCPSRFEIFIKKLGYEWTYAITKIFKLEVIYPPMDGKFHQPYLENVTISVTFDQS